MGLAWAVVVARGSCRRVSSVVVYVCGPPGMMNHISGDKNPDKSQGELKGLLKKLEFSEAQVYKF